jgi:hypothetical protein
MKNVMKERADSRMTRQFGCTIAEWKLINVRKRGEIGVIERGWSTLWILFQLLYWNYVLYTYFIEISCLLIYEWLIAGNTDSALQNFNISGSDRERETNEILWQRQVLRHSICEAIIKRHYFPVMFKELIYSPGALIANHFPLY